MTVRELPMRRASETFEIAFGGLKNSHVVTLGYFAEGDIGEMFLNGGKSGEVVQAIARDAAILFSLCRRYGVPIDVMKHAITRDERGHAVSIIGTAIDLLPEHQAQQEAS